jgi:hypothetical protein
MRLKRFEFWSKGTDGKSILRTIDVDFSAPYISDKGYVKNGGIFLAITEGQDSAKQFVGIDTVAMFIQVLQKAVENHIIMQADCYKEAFEEWKARQPAKQPAKATLV